ncbi:MAG: hypothetical protein CM1200mP29_08010 [Verrucomicrobiota bacterium]|nr:MAG: hypothetical protein CM1200mP29_08010 [Verrucomicrobiota bacterium]
MARMDSSRSESSSSNSTSRPFRASYSCAAKPRNALRRAATPAFLLSSVASMAVAAPVSPRICAICVANGVPYSLA